MVNRKQISVVSISLVLLLSSTACSSQTEEASNVDETRISEQVEDTQPAQETVDRVESNYISNYEISKELSNERKMSKDSYIVINDDETLTLNSYGTIESLEDGTLPAEGEVFHSINYSIPDSSFDKAPNAITIDGKELDSSYSLYGSSNFTISAPENAEIILSLSHEGVTQKINLVTGERLSKGIAETWYKNKTGEISNGFIEKKIKGKNYSATYKAKITDAIRTPYTSFYDWADGGKKTWVMFSYSGEGWGDSNVIDETHRIELVDSKGNKYSPDEHSDQYDFVFLVPDTESKFTVNDIHSTAIKDNNDNTQSIPEFVEKAEIEFK